MCRHSTFNYELFIFPSVYKHITIPSNRSHTPLFLRAGQPPHASEQAQSKVASTCNDMACGTATCHKQLNCHSDALACRFKREDLQVIVYTRKGRASKTFLRDEKLYCYDVCSGKLQYHGDEGKRRRLTSKVKGASTYSRHVLETGSVYCQEDPNYNFDAPKNATIRRGPAEVVFQTQEKGIQAVNHESFITQLHFFLLPYHPTSSNDFRI